jgi:hypothetical protein
MWKDIVGCSSIYKSYSLVVTGGVLEHNQEPANGQALFERIANVSGR